MKLSNIHQDELHADMQYLNANPEKKELWRKVARGTLLAGNVVGSLTGAMLGRIAADQASRVLRGKKAGFLLGGLGAGLGAIPGLMASRHIRDAVDLETSRAGIELNPYRR